MTTPENSELPTITLYQLGQSAVNSDEQNPVVITVGSPGSKGDKGDKGDQGDQGLPGQQGQQGIPGPKGDQGDRGDQGLPGQQGPQGLQGQQGIKGDQGERGPQGIQGIPGIQGLKGDQGDRGVPGLTGDRGPQGIQGIQGIPGDATQAWVISQGYAQLSGATFSGKLVTTQTATTAPLNIGFLSTAPTATVAGDVWVGDNINFKDKNGTSKLVANSSTQNTFSQPQVISPPSNATLPALRITNTAAVNSLVVEDETNPDSTPFIIGSDGRVGIHGSPATNTAHKLAIYNGNIVFSAGFGLAFGDGTIQTTASTAVDLTGYATQSWVTGQNYLTPSALLGYANLNSPIFSGDPRSPTPALGDSDTSIATTAFVKMQGYATLNAPTFTGDARAVTPALSDNDTSIATTAFVKGQGYATESYVTTRGYITSSDLTPYAQLSGATFTGKIFCTAVAGNAGLNIGIGGTEPASTTNGDIWIPSGIGGVINYRDGSGTWRNVLANNLPNIIDVNTATSTALRITQRGGANAFVVEDSTSPDATAFVINQFGKVGVGTAPDATAAIRIDGNGMSFNGMLVNPTIVTGHGGGQSTNDLLIYINGVQYAIPLRATGLII